MLLAEILSSPRGSLFSFKVLLSVEAKFKCEKIKRRKNHTPVKCRNPLELLYLKSELLIWYIENTEMENSGKSWCNSWWCFAFVQILFKSKLDIIWINNYAKYSRECSSKIIIRANIIIRIFYPGNSHFTVCKIFSLFIRNALFW